ncbi:MAG: Ig-like domain-containing protein, partial [Lachnospiraceae bacterium]|nr:Ig-like domain-containing protein [Lachnospiraceae bacterium]
RVQAYHVVDGKKVIIKSSITAHVAGSKDKKRANATGLTLKKNAYTLEKGKTATISAKVKLADKKKTQLSDGHARPLRYSTSNKRVATVSVDGKITAVGSGTCDVYVYAVNGATKKIKVTVK